MTADVYRPGTCNIGPFEIARRRRSAAMFTFVAIVVAGLLLVADLPMPARLAFFPFAAAAAITWLQVIRRFCVGFATVGIRNFGGRGDAQSIEDEGALAADRRAALRMVLEGSLYGAVATALLLVLPG